MTKVDPEREERRRQQSEISESLKASGALDEIFARIDAGEPLIGHEGLLKGMLEASLEPSPTPRALAERVAQLDRIEAGVATIRVPQHFFDQLFDLRGHIDLVRQRLMPKASGTLWVQPRPRPVPVSSASPVPG